ncbi:MAG: hypothetical protein IT159_13280 [Bryobacterales bacterium]|nr:hypothetical protein [Bryobacterales bacterium]
MTSRRFSPLSRGLLAGFALACVLPGQIGQPLMVAPPGKIAAPRGGTSTAKIAVQVRAGYHVNSNTPDDEYLIPLVLTWDSSLVEPRETVYPKPESQSFSFSPKPVSVYSGSFEIVTRFSVPAKAPLGPAVVAGRLRYQACTNTMCLPPRTIDVKLPVEIRAQQ